jgi:hypothetical protein
MKHRRDILKVLGLGSVVGLVNAEAIASDNGCAQYPDMVVPNLVQPSKETQERVANALESLAKEIRAGNVGVQEMQIASSITPDTWMHHKVTIDVEILKDAPTS